MNSVPVGLDFIGIVIHLVGRDGKDIDFITEYQQNIGEENREYAPVGDNLKLPPVTYSVYIITWCNRETIIHNGNFKEYFAKTTIKVK